MMYGMQGMTAMSGGAFSAGYASDCLAAARSRRMSQAVGNMPYGTGMTVMLRRCVQRRVCFLHCWQPQLAPKVQNVGNMPYGMQGMSSDAPEVRSSWHASYYWQAVQEPVQRRAT
jgi:hypothetical protein